MNRSFKLRVNMLDDRLSPAVLAMTTSDPTPPPPDDGGAIVAQTSDAEAGGSTVIVCDELIVKGERPTKK